MSLHVERERLKLKNNISEVEVTSKYNTRFQAVRHPGRLKMLCTGLGITTFYFFLAPHIIEPGNN